MSDIVTLAGSPYADDKSTALLFQARTLLRRSGLNTCALAVRDLPAGDLLHAHTESTAILTMRHLLDEAQGVIVATPLYKGAYAGVLKAFLDLLPSNSLQGKVILPLAIGGLPPQHRALDCALKDLFAALGANDFVEGVYLSDNQLPYAHGGTLHLEPCVEERLQEALTCLTARLACGGVTPRRRSRAA